MPSTAATLSCSDVYVYILRLSSPLRILFFCFLVEARALFRGSREREAEHREREREEVQEKVIKEALGQ